MVPAFLLAGPARFFQSLAGGFQYLVVGGVLAGFIDGFVQGGNGYAEVEA